MIFLNEKCRQIFICSVLALPLTMAGCKSRSAARTLSSKTVVETSTGGKSIQIVDIPRNEDPEDYFDNKLVIGIEVDSSLSGPASGDYSGHYYLINNNQRYDGEIFKKATLSRAEFSTGYFIVFENTNIPAAITENKLRETAAKRSLTCVHAALKAIKALTGYTLAKPENLPYPNALPGETFTAYLEKGFKDASDQPVVTKVYRNNGLALKKFQEILTRREPEARQRFASGKINVSKFELSSSNAPLDDTDQLPPISCHDLH